VVEIVTLETHGRSIAVIEVLGLPGAGKTTVVEAIASTGTIAVMSRYRSLANVPAYSMAALRLAPALASGSWKGCSWRDRNKCIRLESSRSIVRRHARGGADAFVFDQGPLFLLKQLSGNGCARSATEARRVEFLRMWGRTLDLALVLDAPDDVLLQRVGGRDKRHPLQDMSDDLARQALDAERRSFELLLEELRGYGTVRTLRIDTSGSSVRDTGAAVLRSIAAVAAV
jgi:hypothetical protein